MYKGTGLQTMNMQIIQSAYTVSSYTKRLRLLPAYSQITVL